MPQCQFLISAIFVFQKSCTGNVLGIARKKNPGPYFSVKKPEPKEGEQRSQGLARHPLGAARPGTVPRVCLGPPGPRWPRPFAHIFSVSRKPWIPEQKSTKSFDTAVISNPSSERILKLFPAPYRRRRSSSEASTSPCLPPRWCVSSPLRTTGP